MLFILHSMGVRTQDLDSSYEYEEGSSLNSAIISTENAESKVLLFNQTFEVTSSAGLTESNVELQEEATIPLTSVM